MPQDDSGMKAPGESMRNPFIVNFCKVLTEKKGENHEVTDMKKLIEEMYKLFEFLLGQNMIKALPEDVRRNYLGIAEDLENLSYEKIGEVFDKNVPDYERVMKETMKQFAELYMKNRTFKASEYMPQG